MAPRWWEPEQYPVFTALHTIGLEALLARSFAKVPTLKLVKISVLRGKLKARSKKEEGEYSVSDSESGPDMDSDDEDSD